MSTPTARFLPIATLLLAGFTALGVGCAPPDDSEWDEDELGGDAAEDGQEPSAGEMAMAADCPGGDAACSGGGSGSDSGSGSGGGSSPPPRLVVALRSASGHYVVAEGGGGGAVNANRTEIGAWEKFKVIPLGGASFALQASNGQYVVAEGGGGGDVNANRSTIGPWETFTLVNVAGGKTAFQSTVVPKYVVAEGGGGADVNCNRGVLSTWESFKMVDQETTTPAHSVLLTGAPLQGHNGSCVTKVCASSPHCCSTAWDGTCVASALAYCM